MPIDRSTFIRTSSPPTPSAIRWRRSAATSPTGRATRPVTTEQMIAAMDEAGVRQVRHRAGLDLLRPRQLLRRRRGRGPSRPLHRRVLGRRAGGRREPSACATGSAAKLTGLRLFTIGSTMPDQASWLDDPKTYPAWEIRRRARSPGLPADVAQGFPAADRDLIERFPKVKIILDHLRAAAARDGPPYAQPQSLFDARRAIRTST